MKLYSLLFLLFFFALTGCDDKQAATIPHLYNQEASLPDTISFNPLEWKAICSFLNKNDTTTSTLYGNELAVKSARSGVAYPAGSVIALVSWKQKEDPHWFGGRIPGTVLSVERLSFDTTGKVASAGMPEGLVQASYEKYEGAPLQKTGARSSEKVRNRIAYLVSQKASVMP